MRARSWVVPTVAALLLLLLMTDALSLESGWAGCAEVVETAEEEDDTERFDRLGAVSCGLGKPEGDAVADAPLVPLPFAVERVSARSPLVA
jgi:hypothetical protein